MLLYVSNSTAYPLFDKLFDEGKINSGYQMQKFNSNMIEGLSTHEEVCAVSVLPYKKVNASRCAFTYDGVRYICTASIKGAFHKPFNLVSCLKELLRQVAHERPRCIIVDAVAKTPLYASQIIGNLLHIPVVGIVTDFPGQLSLQPSGKTTHLKRMKACDAFILLTEQMNSVINPKSKPYIVIEGLASKSLPKPHCSKESNKTIFLYSGSLWRELAGIEYFTEGFIAANIPDSELHFYGTGELVPWIETINRMHPNVKYMGCVSNSKMVEIQSQVDCLINPRPSKNDFCKYSFPSKTIEYMASATPVLMTRLPGVPDEYFKYVYVIEEESAVGACAAIEKFVSTKAEERVRMGCDARRFIMSKKNANIQAMRVVQLCNDLIGCKR